MAQLPTRYYCLVSRWVGGLLAGWWLGSLPGAAQTLTTRTYTTANGLMQSSVYCLDTDSYGRLWIGTQAGVCVYNGLEFKNYGAAQGLTDSHVRAVAAAPAGPTVWFGLQYGGLAALGANGRVRAVRLPGLRLPGHLLSLWAGPGELWVGTESQGLWRLRCGLGQTDTLYQHWPSGPTGLPADSVAQVGPGLPAGRQWVVTAQGLGVLDAATGQPRPAERAALPAALRQAGVNCFFRVSDSVAWVGTRAGLLRLSGQPGAWRLRRFTLAQGLCTEAVRRVVQDAASRVWANTVAGLSQGTPAPGGRWRWRCFRRQHTSDSDRDHDVLLDREGSVWAASAEGLIQYLTDERFTQYSVGDGLADD